MAYKEKFELQALLFVKHYNVPVVLQSFNFVCIDGKVHEQTLTWLLPSKKHKGTCILLGRSYVQIATHPYEFIQYLNCSRPTGSSGFLNEEISKCVVSGLPASTVTSNIIVPL